VVDGGGTGGGRVGAGRPHSPVVEAQRWRRFFRLAEQQEIKDPGKARTRLRTTGKAAGGPSLKGQEQGRYEGISRIGRRRGWRRTTGQTASGRRRTIGHTTSGAAARWFTVAWWFRFLAATDVKNLMDRRIRAYRNKRERFSQEKMIY
jgi:hypothetical protein